MKSNSFSKNWLDSLIFLFEADICALFGKAVCASAF